MVNILDQLAEFGSELSIPSLRGRVQSGWTPDIQQAAKDALAAVRYRDLGKRLVYAVCRANREAVTSLLDEASKHPIEPGVNPIFPAGVTLAHQLEPDVLKRTVQRHMTEAFKRADAATVAHLFQICDGIGGCHPMVEETCVQLLTLGGEPEAVALALSSLATYGAPEQLPTVVESEPLERTLRSFLVRSLVQADSQQVADLLRAVELLGERVGGFVEQVCLDVLAKDYDSDVEVLALGGLADHGTTRCAPVVSGLTRGFFRSRAVKRAAEETLEALESRGAAVVGALAMAESPSEDGALSLATGDEGKLSL